MLGDGVCYVCKDRLAALKNNGKTQGMCRQCKREYNRLHYIKDKQKYIYRAVDAKRASRELTNKLKDVPCKDCGKKYPPYVMHFDHINPENKTYQISTL